MHPKANEIVALATDMIGTRYRHMGRNRSCVDCAGMIIYIGQQLQLFPAGFNVTNYSKRPNVSEFSKGMRTSGSIPTNLNERSHGDIIRMALQGWPVHLSILEVDPFGTEYLIHALAERKQVVREPLNEIRFNEISSVWRYPING